MPQPYNPSPNLSPAGESTPNGINVEGFDGQQVNVYSIDGRRVDTFRAGGKQLRHLGQGIYIVTMGQHSYKVSVR